jgi:hypothetical protein
MWRPNAYDSVMTRGEENQDSGESEKTQKRKTDERGKGRYGIQRKNIEDGVRKQDTKSRVD